MIVQGTKKKKKKVEIERRNRVGPLAEWKSTRQRCHTVWQCDKKKKYGGKEVVVVKEKSRETWRENSRAIRTVVEDLTTARLVRLTRPGSELSYLFNLLSILSDTYISFDASPILRPRIYCQGYCTQRNQPMLPTVQ